MYLEVKAAHHRNFRSLLTVRGTDLTTTTGVNKVFCSTGLPRTLHHPNASRQLFTQCGIKSIRRQLKYVTRVVTAFQSPKLITLQKRLAPAMGRGAYDTTNPSEENPAWATQPCTLRTNRGRSVRYDTSDLSSGPLDLTTHRLLLLKPLPSRRKKSSSGRRNQEALW